MNSNPSFWNERRFCSGKAWFAYAFLGTLLSLVPVPCAASDFVIVLRAGEERQELTNIVQCTLSKGLSKSSDGLEWSMKLSVVVLREDVVRLREFTSEHSPGSIQVEIADVKIAEPVLSTAITDGRFDLTIPNDDAYERIREVLKALEGNDREDPDQ